MECQERAEASEKIETFPYVLHKGTEATLCPYRLTSSHATEGDTRRLHDVGIFIVVFENSCCVQRERT